MKRIGGFASTTVGNLYYEPVEDKSPDQGVSQSADVLPKRVDVREQFGHILRRFDARSDEDKCCQGLTGAAQEPGALLRQVQMHGRHYAGATRNGRFGSRASRD